MAKTSTQDWQALFQDWQTQQLSTTKQFFDTFGQWQKNFTDATTASDSADADINEPYANAQSMAKFNQAFWDNISQQYAEVVGDGTQQLLFKSLSDMTQPENWLNLSGDLFNMGAHKLSEKPFVSGISDIEERLAYVNDSWQNLLKENQQYHGVVINSWVTAYNKFLETVKAQQADDSEKVFSPRELINLWTSIANEELMSLHRSERFLSAQKEMIKASMEYRLHEKNVAEVFCETYHIPTRAEVDELHQSVTELKRELRKTKQRLQQVETQAKPKPKATSRKTASQKSTKPSD